jgi:putative hemolysin
LSLENFARKIQLPQSFKPKIKLEIKVGRFLTKTISSIEELRVAFLLRYQVFQVEMIGHQNAEGEDCDKYDELSDHVGVFDTKTNQMIATCRLNCSLFSNQFYSSQEFDCESLLNRPENKLEIGRVCVHRDFRSSIILMLLWRAIAEYMSKANVEILFGCGSVMTQDPNDALILFKYIDAKGRISSQFEVSVTEKYRSKEFESLLLTNTQKITEKEILRAELLLPPLCKSYFDIGCKISGPPAFDNDFKCIDFLTILESKNLNPRVRQKMIENSGL